MIIQLLVKFRQIFINIGETPKSIQFKQHPRANGAVQRDQIENSGNFASAEWLQEIIGETYAEHLNAETPEKDLSHISSVPAAGRVQRSDAGRSAL